MRFVCSFIFALIGIFLVGCKESGAKLKGSSAAETSVVPAELSESEPVRGDNESIQDESDDEENPEVEPVTGTTQGDARSCCDEICQETADISDQDMDPIAFDDTESSVSDESVAASSVEEAIPAPEVDAVKPVVVEETLSEPEQENEVKPVVVEETLPEPEQEDEFKPVVVEETLPEPKEEDAQPVVEEALPAPEQEEDAQPVVEEALPAPEEEDAQSEEEEYEDETVDEETTPAEPQKSFEAFMSFLSTPLFGSAQDPVNPTYLQYIKDGLATPFNWGVVLAAAAGLALNEFGLSNMNLFSTAPSILSK